MYLIPFHLFHSSHYHEPVLPNKVPPTSCDTHTLSILLKLTALLQDPTSLSLSPQRPPINLIETGGSLKVQTTTPHLVGLGSGRLSVAITLMPLNEGVTRIGREDASVPQDITIEGLGIEAEHCRIINRGGVITLHPSGNLCSLDGVHVSKPTLLTQGFTLCLGKSYFFRFNHPEEARRMKSMQPQKSPGPGSPSLPESTKAFRPVSLRQHSSIFRRSFPYPQTMFVLGPEPSEGRSSLVSPSLVSILQGLITVWLLDPTHAGCLSLSQLIGVRLEYRVCFYCAPRQDHIYTLMRVWFLCI
uniref:FHA domain-containing protein n=1 Tax=Oncorhynchus mykiss TaxID=8022 RepID=A0A8K9V3D5_ONCMY